MHDLITDYFIAAVIYFIAGLLSFGGIPILCSYLDLTYDVELVYNPKDKEKEKGSQQNESRSEHNVVFINQIAEEDEEELAVRKKSNN